MSSDIPKTIHNKINIFNNTHLGLNFLHFLIIYLLDIGYFFSVAKSCLAKEEHNDYLSSFKHCLIIDFGLRLVLINFIIMVDMELLTTDIILTKEYFTNVAYSYYSTTSSKIAYYFD